MAEDGVIEATYGPGETALYAEGDVPAAPMPRQIADTVRTLDGPWTIQPVVSHEVGKDDSSFDRLNHMSGLYGPVAIAVDGQI